MFGFARTGSARGEWLERGAQPAQDAALVRRAVEVDAWVGAGLGLEET